jgi:predicted metalloprotease with PDZ domain
MASRSYGSGRGRSALYTTKGATKQGSPAFKAGLTEATQILAINGIAYDPDVLSDAIRAAKSTRSAIELVVKTGDRYRVTRSEYYDGLRYPHLERDPAVPPRLDEILADRKS